ncbi:unnamed protein product [Effrenium voratum]|nr:unnamed protein product [Effrenium voratum]
MWSRRWPWGVLLLLRCLAEEAEFVEEEGVLVLTEKNFEVAIKSHPYILVQFFAPWCGHCKQFAPEYAKAAQQLKQTNQPIRLAKVDATAEVKLAEDHGVRGYPTIRLFIDGRDQEYTGGRTEQSIVTWVLKKAGPPALELETVEAAEAFEKENRLAVFCFCDPAARAAFEQAARQIERPGVTRPVGARAGAMESLLKTVQEQQLDLLNLLRQQQSQLEVAVKAAFQDERPSPRLPRISELNSSGVVNGRQTRAVQRMRISLDATEASPSLKTVVSDSSLSLGDIFSRIQSPLSDKPDKPNTAPEPEDKPEASETPSSSPRAQPGISTGLTWLSMDAEPQPVGYRGNSLAAVLILLNAVVQILELELSGRAASSEVGLPASLDFLHFAVVFQTVDAVFNLIFTGELVLRMIAERGSFHKELANWFDVMLVLVGLVDLVAFQLISLESADAEPYGQLIHALKALRAVRMLRYFRFIEGIRLLLKACSAFLPPGRKASARREVDLLTLRHSSDTDTLDAAQSDAEMQVLQGLRQKAEYVGKLESVFQTLDESGQGMITEDGLNKMLADPKVKAYFQTLDVDVQEGTALFHILDNGDGEVTLDEFTNGILRCKGSARAIDQLVMQSDLKHVIKEIRRSPA